MQFRVVAEEVPLFGTVKWACRLRELEIAPLLKMLPPSRGSNLGKYGSLALFHLLCRIAGESQNSDV